MRDGGRPLELDVWLSAPLDDLTAALTWLRTRAAGLGIDPERVVARGESAGGRLAALLVLTAVPLLRGRVVWYGATDLTAARRTPPRRRCSAPPPPMPRNAPAKPARSSASRRTPRPS
ncbi:alpha/beta hydrolase [Streptomyces sp. NPDC093586]|uniref:alpha/beta hydrolase n=1 Tax=Streptomyces sp. NPDC093586 TaxID=3366042 RepID=UPI0037F9F012